MNFPETQTTAPSDDPFVNAQHAAYVTQLPIYYFVSKAQRKKLQLPHYRIGGAVRFKLAEICAWRERRAVHALEARGVNA